LEDNIFKPHLQKDLSASVCMEGIMTPNESTDFFREGTVRYGTYAHSYIILQQKHRKVDHFFIFFNALV
jgi:hypothetical protein